MPAVLLEVLAVLAGVALLGLVLWDMTVTTLHPAARGPLSRTVNRGVWRAVQRVPGRGRRRASSFAGPAAVVLTFGLWLASTLLAYAIVFWPFEDRHVASEGEPVGSGGFLEALYLSGTALSTVGFGDVVATSQALRLVTVAESLSGLVIITAGISYLLSINPYLLGVRGGAARLAELGAVEPEGAARLATTGGAATVERLHSDLVDAHGSLRRFPVLFLFEPHDPEASMLTLLRAASSACLVLRWGTRPGAPPFAELYGRALEATLSRIREDYREQFPDLLHHAPRPQHPPEPAAARFARLRAAVAAAAPGVVAPDGEAPPELTAFLAATDPFLAALATAYGQDVAPLLAPARQDLRSGD